jgi:hypothetical protein
MNAPLSPFELALRDEGVLGTPLEQIIRKTRTFESSNNPNAVSNRGAIGAMQVMPGTFVEVADPGWDIKNEYHNDRAGIRYMKKGWEKSGGDVALTGAFYYGGPGGMEKARRDEAVWDPVNPKNPNTLEYGQRLANAVGAPAGSNQVSNMNPYANFDFEGTYNNALKALGPVTPSPEAVQMFSESNQRRAANLPLALAAMISRDQGMNRAGQEMYADAVLAGRPMPMGDSGWVSPDGRFIESPDAQMRAKEHALRMTISQMEKARAQANSDRTYGLGVAGLQNTIEKMNQGLTNDGPTPADVVAGRSPGYTPALPMAIGAGQRPMPQGVPAPNPQAAAPQVSSVPAQAQPAMGSQTVAPPAAAVQPMTKQAAPIQAAPQVSPNPADTPAEPLTSAQPAVQQSAPQNPVGNRLYVKDGIGKDVKRIGRASDGSGDVYSSPMGGEYVLDLAEGPNKGKYFMRPESVNVIPDRQAIPADKLKEYNEGYANLDKLQRTIGEFKPQYAGKVLDEIGKVQNFLGTRQENSSLADQAQWWQNWDTFFNGVIKTLAGSTVTEGEAKRLAATAVTPGMDPKYVDRRVREISRDMAKALNLLRNSYDKQGFVVDGLNPAIEDIPSGGQIGGVTITRE